MSFHSHEFNNGVVCYINDSYMFPLFLPSLNILTYESLKCLAHLPRTHDHWMQIYISLVIQRELKLYQAFLNIPTPYFNQTKFRGA